jgi:drug/metabolite transporter superfamily protein YnfA
LAIEYSGQVARSGFGQHSHLQAYESEKWRNNELEKDCLNNWLLVPAAASIALLPGCLRFTPQREANVRRLWGCLYFHGWLRLWAVDGIRPTAWDVAGSPMTIAGMAIIIFGSRQA